eukprot:15276-Heterococcus_DN1.PRE.2
MLCETVLRGVLLNQCACNNLRTHTHKHYFTWELTSSCTTAQWLPEIYEGFYNGPQEASPIELVAALVAVVQALHAAPGADWSELQCTQRSKKPLPKDSRCDLAPTTQNSASSRAASTVVQQHRIAE